MTRDPWLDAALVVVLAGLLVHLPLPAQGDTAASVRDHVAAFFPDQGVLTDVALRTIDSGDMDSDEDFTRTFEQAGGFAYHCHPHPWMRALVVVEPDSGAPPETHTVAIVEGLPDAPDEWGFMPQNLTIEQGDKVVWTNDGSIIHTVTGNMGQARTLAEADAEVDQQQRAEVAIFAIVMLVSMVVAALAAVVVVRRLDLRDRRG